MDKPHNTATPTLVNPLEAHLGYQLRRTSALMMAELGARLARTGMRPAETAVLLLIRANAGCQQGAVGALLGIKPANMVPLAARLVKQGLVERTRADGRTHALSLTRRGRVRAAVVSRLLDSHEKAFQSRLDRRAFKGLLAAMATLRK